jgi:hypothetical protein
MEPRAAQPHHRDTYLPDAPRERLAFRHAHHSAASPIVHVIKTGIMLSPLVLSEFVKDPNQIHKYTRMSILTATLADQIDYAIRCHADKERERCQERSWADRSRSSEENAERSWSR